MNKLPIALLVGAMAVSTGVMAAEQDDQATRVDPKDCSQLSDKEKDQCVQATPAGPVEMQTGEKSKGKSEIAKDRDRAKKENQGDSDAPAQGNAAVGNPSEQGTTGEAQTGATADTASDRAIPEQSKDTVGQPDERRATGEAQSGQEPDEEMARKPN